MTTININIPSPDNYNQWDVWGKALVRAMLSIFAYTQIVQDVGNVTSFPKVMTPTQLPGWLQCNGQNFDQNGYPILYQLLGTNTLPTLASPYGSNYNVWMKAA